MLDHHRSECSVITMAGAGPIAAQCRGHADQSEAALAKLLVCFIGNHLMKCRGSIINFNKDLEICSEDRG